MSNLCQRSTQWVIDIHARCINGGITVSAIGARTAVTGVAASLVTPAYAQGSPRKDVP